MIRADKAPPQCVHTEQKILGLAIHHAHPSRGNFHCLDVLPSDFYFAAHQAIFSAVGRIVASRGRLDVANIANEVRNGSDEWGESAGCDLNALVAEVIEQAESWEINGFESEEETMAGFIKLVALRQTIQFATDLLGDCYDQDAKTEMRGFLQPFANRLDLIAKEAGVLLDDPVR